MIVDDLPVLRLERPVIGQLNPLIRELREMGPVVKVRTPAGDEAWLVTRHAELKQLLKDDRLGGWHPDPANRPRYFDNPMLDMAVSAESPAAAHVLHTTMRSKLTPHFSAKQMSRLRSRVAERVEAALDAIEAEQPPVDLHARLSLPLSFDVLCDLLGVSDRATFMSLLTEAGSVDGSRNASDGVGTLFDHLAEVIAEKRLSLGEDLISDLCESGLPDAYIRGLLVITSFAYLVTPSNLSAGIALFAANPDQREKVVRAPELIETAVDEVLRMGKITEAFQPRYAAADIEVGGVVIRAGDLVLCDHYAAGFDDRVFDEPERFDVTRSPNPHLAFSHGISYCIGAPLARIELEEAIGRLLRRLPNLRLAVPIKAIGTVAGAQLGGGIGQLPVTW